MKKPRCKATGCQDQNQIFIINFSFLRFKKHYCEEKGFEMTKRWGLERGESPLGMCVCCISLRKGGEKIGYI